MMIWCTLLLLLFLFLNLFSIYCRRRRLLGIINALLIPRILEGNHRAHGLESELIIYPISMISGSLLWLREY